MPSTITVNSQALSNKIALQGRWFGPKTTWDRVPAWICFLCICLFVFFGLVLLLKTIPTPCTGATRTHTHLFNTPIAPTRIRTLAASVGLVFLTRRPRWERGPDLWQRPDGLTAVRRSFSASRGHISAPSLIPLFCRPLFFFFFTWPRVTCCRGAQMDGLFTGQMWA